MVCVRIDALSAMDRLDTLYMSQIAGYNECWVRMACFYCRRMVRMRPVLFCMYREKLRQRPFRQSKSSLDFFVESRLGSHRGPVFGKSHGGLQLDPIRES